MSPRHQHVDRGHHKQRKGCPDDHAADQHDSDTVSRARSRTGGKDERQVAEYGSCGRHQDWAQSRTGRLRDGVELVYSFLLQVVCELNDQDAILRYQTDQRDQSYLAVDVVSGQSEEREGQRAGNGQRHRARKNNERIAEAFKLRREHQIDQHSREQKSAEELAALNPELTRFTRIVPGKSLRQGRLGRVLQERALSSGTGGGITP